MCSNRDRTAWHQSWPQRSYRFNKYAMRTLIWKKMLWNYVEYVNLAMVWNAAEGLCESCHEPVDLNAPKTSREKAHFDHRFPLCWGGRHEQSNVQLLHQRCHIEKSRIKRHD